MLIASQNLLVQYAHNEHACSVASRVWKKAVKVKQGVQRLERWKKSVGACLKVSWFR